MTRKKSFLISFVFVILLAACGSSLSAPQRPEMSGAAEPVFEEAEIAVSERGAFLSVDEFDADLAFSTDTIAANTAVQTSQPQVDPGRQRLIIRTGELNIVVTDTEEAMAAITRMVNENGGWVISSSAYQYNDNAMTGSITVRVPADGFQSAIEAIKGLAAEVTNETTSGQDVTEEFVDLSARLENLEATADRVRNFLDEAKDVEEALAVNSELSRLEGEIEAMKGRLQYLSQSAAFSTITVHLTPDVLAQPIEVAGWRPQGVAREAVEALIETLQVIASAGIWIGIYVLPLGLMVAAPTFLVVRTWRRYRTRRRVASTSSGPAT